MWIFPLLRDWIKGFLNENRGMVASRVGHNMLIEQVYFVNLVFYFRSPRSGSRNVERGSLLRVIVHIYSRWSECGFWCILEYTNMCFITKGKVQIKVHAWVNKGAAMPTARSPSGSMKCSRLGPSLLRVSITYLRLLVTLIYLGAEAAAVPGQVRLLWQQSRHQGATRAIAVTAGRQERSAFPQGRG